MKQIKLTDEEILQIKAQRAEKKRVVKRGVAKYDLYYCDESYIISNSLDDKICALLNKTQNQKEYFTISEIVEIREQIEKIVNDFIKEIHSFFPIVANKGDIFEKKGGEWRNTNSQTKSHFPYDDSNEIHLENIVEVEK